MQEYRLIQVPLANDVPNRRHTDDTVTAIHTIYKGTNGVHVWVTFTCIFCTGLLGLFILDKDNAALLFRQIYLPFVNFNAPAFCTIL